MKKLLVSTVLIAIVGCTPAENQPNQENKKNETIQKPSHQYGGWYCPDNLNGFPAVNLKEWKNVPVINGRLPTEEEAKSEKSLIFIDTNVYPNSKAMDIELPKLAKFYNHHSKKTEIIIVIQAIEIQGDSIVGFRYLNGGNGSAHYKEVTFISENEVATISDAKFVSFDININASDDKIWEVMTQSTFTNKLQPVFDIKNYLTNDWKTKSNINYNYTNLKNLTNKYANKMYGCWYIQNDYLIDSFGYVEKFLLLRGEEANQTELKIVCGPFKDDFETQQFVLHQWAEKVKELSEE
ncbi:MAG TPA: hypothetical protein VIN73_07825 [Vicingaceae bacterium]